MKIAAKGVLPNGYWHLGRHWPRETTVEVEVSAEEYAIISADRNIVAVVIPEARQQQPQQQNHQKQQFNQKGQ